MRHARRAARPDGAAPGALAALAASSATARLWSLCTGLVAVCLAFAGGMPLLSPAEATSFDGRVMGQTVASGVDVSADVARYYALIAVFVASGVAALLLASLLEARARVSSPASGELRSAAREYGYVTALLAALTPLVGWPVWPVLLCHALGTLHYGLGLAAGAGRAVEPRLVRAALLALAPYVVFAAVSRTLAGSWLSARALASAALPVALALLCLALLRTSYRGDAARFARCLERAALAPLAALALNPALLELKNVLVARGALGEPRPYLVYAGLVALSSAAFLVLLARGAREGADVPEDRLPRVERWCHVLLVLGVLLAAAQPPVSVEYGTEYFESANHGLALDGLFRYGEVPIVGSFDAHMLLRQLTGMLYYILSPYEPWANTIYNSLRSLPVFIVLYRLLARLVSERAAALWVTLCPVAFLVVCAGPPVDSLSFWFLPLLALLRALRRPTAGSYALFCAAVTLTCLIGLDAGVASIAAGAATFLVCLLRSRGSVRPGLLAAVAAGFVAGALALWAALCLASGVDPVTRLREFVLLAASNANWAVYPVGDLDALVTPLLYFAAPLGGCALLAWFALVAPVDLRAADVRGRTAAAAWVGTVFLCVFFLANLSRGVVRHNLTEGGAGALLSTLGAAAVCAVAYACARRGTRPAETFGGIVLAGACATALLGLGASSGVGYLGGFESQLVAAAGEWGSSEQYKTSPEGGSRVTGSSAADETLAAVLDATTSPDETYLTLSSTDYLYAIVGRRNPIYANQSPLMLSGDESQELALEELDAAEVPYVLMPRDAWTIADGLDVSFKYYRLFERVYEDYEPFLRIDGADYDLWCLSERADELRAALEASGPESGWSYASDYAPGFLGELGEVPRLWAEGDEKDAWSSPVTAEGAGPVELSPGVAATVGLTGDAGGSPAYVALVVDASAEGELALTFGEAGSERTLTLALAEGEHRYLVRASAYYEWWEGDVGSVELTSTVGATLVSLDVREGD